MKHLILIIALFFGTYLQAQNLEPVKQQVGKLQISVDPRMELLSTIQILSNYPVIDREMDYGGEIRTRFAAFSKLKAVSLTDELYKTAGFSYDAPVAFMLYLSQVPELKQELTNTDYLIKRAGGKKNLENYRTAIADFAKESNFKAFWDENNAFYRKIVDLTAQETGNLNLVKVLEDYYNETQNSYNIVLSPLFAGGYGPRIAAENGKYDIYSCVETTNEKNGIPYLNLKNLTFYAWHEFGHSFVNHLTEKYFKKINASKKLFTPIETDMSRQAYGDWSTCVNEHIVRAVHIRLTEQNTGEKEAKNQLNGELARRFIYTPAIIEKLKEFEKQRDTKNITFSDFYPQFITLFDSLSKAEYWKSVKIPFTGPINNVSNGKKRAWIYPTHDEDKEALKKAQNYITMVYDHFKKGDDLLLADTTALHTDISDYGIIAYGTIESNLFLAKYQSSFPFKIEDNTLYADDQYDERKLKFITCVPNPANPKKGMVIYTAFSNANIVGINDIFHGGEDYIIAIDRETILSRGYYDKTDKWKFEE